MDKAEKEKQAQQDLRAVMATGEGRRLLWSIIDGTAAVFSNSFSGDALGTAFNEGRRAVGISLMGRAQQASPADYMRALNEALTERELEAEAGRKRFSED